MDHELAREVAWNTIKTQNMTQREKERVLLEIKLYKQLDSPCILKLIKAWRNKANDEVVMITELMTCSLKEYLHSRPERPRLRVIKNWCKSLLEGLEYLHSRNPPVIHRDLKCENIFISSSSAEIRIGDLGLSTTLKESHLKSQVGTPYFMAPEMYEERYGPGVDIYSFGLCVIEMCTLRTPYSECTNQAMLFQKIRSGEKPEALHMIGNDSIQEFVTSCIQRADLRPTAKQLLGHRFLEIASEDTTVNMPVPIVLSSSAAEVRQQNEILEIKNEGFNDPILNMSLIVRNVSGSRSLVRFDFNTVEEVPENVAEELVKHLGLGQGSIPVILKALECKRISREAEVPERAPEIQTPSFRGKSPGQILNFSIKLGIQENNFLKKVSVEINFDPSKDTIEAVAEHTVQELGLDSEDYPGILDLMRKKILEFDSNIYSSYSCLELLDITNNSEAVSPFPAQNHAHSNATGSVTSEPKSSQSNSSKSSSFGMIGVQPCGEESFGEIASPINTYSGGRKLCIYDENEIGQRKEGFKGIISRKNVCNNVGDVKNLQEALRVIFNAKIKANGVYNKKTERLVKIFQTKYYGSVDGVVNQRIWEDVMACAYSG